MTVEAFTPQNEKQNIGEVNHKDGVGSSNAAAKIAADFLSDYSTDRGKATQEWQGTAAGGFRDGVHAAIDPDARQLPTLELVDHISNEQSISPLLANNGALFDKLDNYQNGGGKDGSIGKGDIKAYLDDPNNNQNADEFRFVQQLSVGLITDSNGNSALNGDGGIDRDQIGRLTGVDLTNQNLSASDLAGTITQNTQDQVSQLSAQTANATDFNPGSPNGNLGDAPNNVPPCDGSNPPSDGSNPPANPNVPPKPGDDRAMSDSVAQSGDGYIKIAARLLGADNTDDPNVQQAAKEMQSLNPGERKDGWLDLNEQVLTPDGS